MQPFEEIVEEHGAVVLRVLRTYLAPADADDAWSDTFLAAMRAYPRIRPDSHVRSWLVTIARRKAIDRLRAKRPTPVAPDDLPETVSSHGVPEPADDCLTAAMARLTARQRDAIVYHYVAGLPYAQVGELLGSGEAAARRSASDGLAALRSTYRGDGRA